MSTDRTACPLPICHPEERISSACEGHCDEEPALSEVEGIYAFARVAAGHSRCIEARLQELGLFCQSPERSREGNRRVANNTGIPTTRRCGATTNAQAALNLLNLPNEEETLGSTPAKRWIKLGQRRSWSDDTYSSQTSVGWPVP
jgi:hypothetical protein